MSYSAEQSEQLLAVAAERTAKSGIPVLGNVDCSHTDPMLTLPLGSSVTLDAGRRTFRALEVATRD
jgi:muramoyltetrapeptide carboxypeptidase LdcA involved in peptidoglycan recycling